MSIRAKRFAFKCRTGIHRSSVGPKWNVCLHKFGGLNSQRRDEVREHIMEMLCTKKDLREPNIRRMMRSRPSSKNQYEYNPDNKEIIHSP